MTSYINEPTSSEIFDIEDEIKLFIEKDVDDYITLYADVDELGCVSPEIILCRNNNNIFICEVSWKWDGKIDNLLNSDFCLYYKIVDGWTVDEILKECRNYSGHWVYYK